MPKYGHSNCAVCNAPVCPSHIEEKSSNNNNINKKFIHIDTYDEYFHAWLMEGVGIYEEYCCNRRHPNKKSHTDLDGNIVYNVTTHNDKIVGTLTDRNKKMNHFSYSNIQSALFLHAYCWEQVKMIREIINERTSAKSLWWFLAVYSIGTNLVTLEDDTSQDYTDLHLLKNPNINKMNKDRINSRLEQMILHYDEWSSNFQIGYWEMR